MTMPILAGDTWDSNVITGAAKGKNVKVCVTTFFDEGAESEAAKAFVSGIAFDEIGDAIRDAAFVKEVDTATGEWKFVAIQGVN